jgi:hypothetical protein
LSDISPQSRSGGGEDMHVSGYEGSQLPLTIVASIVSIPEKRTIDGILRSILIKMMR